jgi:hypothetical protein
MKQNFADELDAFVRQLENDPILMALNPNRPTVAEVQEALKQNRKSAATPQD